MTRGGQHLPTTRPEALPGEIPRDRRQASRSLTTRGRAGARRHLACRTGRALMRRVAPCSRHVGRGLRIFLGGTMSPLDQLDREISDRAKPSFRRPVRQRRVNAPQQSPLVVEQNWL